MTWQALVSDGGLQPEGGALTVALVVDGTSSTGLRQSTINEFQEYFDPLKAV